MIFKLIITAKGYEKHITINGKEYVQVSSYDPYIGVRIIKNEFEEISYAEHPIMHYISELNTATDMIDIIEVMEQIAK